MKLSDVSIKRPVICLVASILIVLIGGLAFRKLPVREYPSTDSPVISIDVSYRGASAEVVESKIVEVIEKEVSAIDGLRVLRSWSYEQRGRISLEFNVDRSIDEAANDVRDKVARVRGRLPTEVDDPQISKADSESDPVVSLSFNSEGHSRLELTELVDRLAVQRLQTIPGVASVELRGQRYAMRLWVDATKLAAYNLTVSDLERALRQQNVDLPSGRIESLAREFPVQLRGRMDEPHEFENLILASREGYQVKFSDVGRVELGPSDYRTFTYFRGRQAVSVSVLRQSQSNLLEVAQSVKALIPVLQADMPEGVKVEVSSDYSVFVDRSVREVYKTLWEAAVLVILMIFLFLRDWRATLIPLLAIPVSIIGTFAVMSWLGFTINTLTLLALVLAVGLVVDDAIVMLENIFRRIELGEAPIHAAIFGARQVAFAIISTTLTLAAVFLPVAFQSGQTGRLFFEFGLTLAISVTVSAFVALTLSPMLCSRLLRAKTAGGKPQHGWFYRKTEPLFVGLNNGFEWVLRGALHLRAAVLLLSLLFAVAGPYLYTKLQRELTPLEDRGVFSATFIGPMGSTPEYNAIYSRQMEQMILDLPEIDRTYHSSHGTRTFVFATLKPWEQRERKTQDIIEEVRRKLRQEITGGQAAASPVRPFGGSRRSSGFGSGVQLVLQGSDFDKLQALGQQVLGVMRDNSMFLVPRVDPSPTKPQLDVRIERAKAADLGVSVSDVAATLETLLGGRRVTQFQRGNQQYDVLVQVEDANRTQPSDLARLYVRSSTGKLVQLSNLVNYAESVVPESFPHFNRLRSVTVSAQLAQGVTIGDAIAFLGTQCRDMLPAGYAFTWDGESREFVESAQDTYMLFGLALLFTFLVLAAQFESWIHPITIFTGIILAVSGGLVVLYCTRFFGPALTDNIFSRFGLIMLIGMVAKNGILVVEFANQLQVAGKNAFDAAFEASTIRFRPILMTSIATVLGAVPIAFASGAGAETRNPMGIVVVGGLSIATVLTLFVVPIVYVLMDRLCVKMTGHSSAHGLVRAAEIDRETASAAVPEPAPSS
ncbi:MAG: efflux RND transporter permease subunit [Verrucomicrobia bacterium]|nr:efflux RND transporter permease subunit [Verrucomicrobiota bacterium]